jgi:hypothetical protein
MKRLTIVFGLSFLLGTGSVSADTRTTNSDKKATIELVTKETRSLKEKELLSRLNIIHGIATKGNLSASDKEGYRKEVRDIQRELKQMQGFYVYLSLTAIIVILILLLLL